MDFSEALLEIKAGRQLSREGWNAPGQFVYLVDGSRFLVDRPPPPGICAQGTPITYPWQPTQGDVLATDWLVADDMRRPARQMAGEQDDPPEAELIRAFGSALNEILNDGKLVDPSYGFLLLVSEHVEGSETTQIQFVGNIGKTDILKLMRTVGEQLSEPGRALYLPGLPDQTPN